jgi:Na+-translocating ferredoxin:NAD+ oxidoreductase subunit B
VNEVVIYAVVSLGSIGATAAVILFFIAQRFKVIEDPRIDIIADLLPAANCGGCGFAGCRNFAEAIVKAGNMDNLFCPPGGNDLAAVIAPVLGIEAVEKDPEIAVVRCNGSRVNAPVKINYQGPSSCAFAHALFAGESGCPNGCLGLGDCVVSCSFDAIEIDATSGLAVVNDKCVACGACVKACPRAIIEMRPRGKKDKRIYVCCINTEKGGPAKKNCSVACIGCSKCMKVCPHDAITITNNLSYIDPLKCKLCRKCVPECPTAAILELNFPPRKVKATAEESEKANE